MTARRAKPNPESHPQAAFSFGQQPGPLNAWSLYAPFAAQSAPGAQAALNGFEAALKSWRNLLDMSRMMIREQQDFTLRALRAQLTVAAGEKESAEEASAGQSVLWPMTAAAQSYAQMGNAFIQAQREALEAISRSSAVH